MHEGLLYDKLEGGKVRCRVCPRLCVIAEGKTGVCRTRLNQGGSCFSLIYGKVCSVVADPIEKKPLFHFHPGSTCLSLGTLGCNLRCVHCQNWQIADADAVREDGELRDLPPEKIPYVAAASGCQGVAWTYNEPTIWLEYAIDGARACHQNGLYTVFVTNGYITSEALELVAPHLDAYRVDIKGFRAETYRFLARIKDATPIFEAAKAARHRFGCHVEVVTNIIPTVNDDDETLAGIAGWIAGELGKKTPWHVTRFHPYLELSHLPPTPIATLEHAVELGRGAGLEFIYVGNVPGHPGENTVCPGCRRLLVKRDGYSLGRVDAREGRCIHCGEDLNVVQGKEN